MAFQVQLLIGMRAPREGERCQLGEAASSLDESVDDTATRTFAKCNIILEAL